MLRPPQIVHEPADRVAQEPRKLARRDVGVSDAPKHAHLGGLCSTFIFWMSRTSVLPLPSRVTNFDGVRGVQAGLNIATSARHRGATTINGSSSMNVVTIPGLNPATFFVCGDGSNTAIAMSRLENGPLSTENATEQLKRTMNPVDAEAWKVRCEFAIAPASRYIIRTSIT